MKTRFIGMMVVAVVLASGAPHVQATASQSSTEFVGTTPCGNAVRVFLGDNPGGSACPAITWRLDLGAKQGDTPGWSLAASYQTPMATNPHRIDSPDVTARGRLEKSGATYRLISSTGRSISFRQVSSTLIHVLDDNNRLMVGTAAYSYTLSRSDAMDDRGQPEMRPGESYSLSPKETGDTLFGIFGGRTPCMGFARALHIGLTDGCQRLKLRVTLLRKAVTHEPATYKLEGSLHHKARVGAWHIVRGMSSDPNAVVYQLDGTSTEGPMFLWKADDDVLFILDEHKQPMGGTVDFSYTLNRGQ